MRRYHSGARLIFNDSRSPRRTAAQTHSVFRLFRVLRRAERSVARPWCRAASYRIDRAVIAFETALGGAR
jgi:hypothetical protein